MLRRFSASATAVDDRRLGCDGLRAASAETFTAIGTTGRDGTRPAANRLQRSVRIHYHTGETATIEWGDGTQQLTWVPRRSRRYRSTGAWRGQDTPRTRPHLPRAGRRGRRARARDGAAETRSRGPRRPLGRNRRAWTMAEMDRVQRPRGSFSRRLPRAGGDRPKRSMNTFFPGPSAPRTPAGIHPTPSATSDSGPKPPPAGGMGLAPSRHARHPEETRTTRCSRSCTTTAPL